jgi:hypothetical protein
MAASASIKREGSVEALIERRLEGSKGMSEM